MSLTLVKRLADEPEAPLPAPPPPPPTPATPIRYRDGFGRELPDADLALREAAIGILMRRLSRQVHGHVHGRSGPVVYEEALAQ